MDASPTAEARLPGFGFTFADLAAREGLIRLDKLFLAQLAAQDAGLHARLLAARAAPVGLATKDEADLIVALGPALDGFLGALFGITAELDALVAETRALDPIHRCKRLFVQRQAVKRYPDPSGFDGPALAAALAARAGEAVTEVGFAHAVAAWEAAGDAEALDLAARYAAWATLTPAGHAAHAGGTLFRVPHRIDPAHLVPVETIERDGVTMLRLPEPGWRPRDGFSLTDAGMGDAAGARPDELLHLVPRAGQGFLLQGPAGPQDRRIPEIALRRDA